MIMKNWITPLVIFCLSATLTNTANAELSLDSTNADEKGLAIATELKARDRGWQDSTATMEMQLFKGDELAATREMRIMGLEVQGDGDKSLTIFDTPRDVQGTAFLSFTHILDADEQWLYLPALGRVKQIASKNKTSPFMGSEFSYEDLNSFEVERYDYTWLRDEVVDGMECYVIEARPRDQYSGYSRQISWVDKDQFRILKGEYYDKRDKFMKTISFEGYQQYLDQYWRPARQIMVNHQNKRKTIIVMKDYQFRTGLQESDFTQNSLKRAR